MGQNSQKVIFNLNSKQFHKPLFEEQYNKIEDLKIDKDKVFIEIEFESLTSKNIETLKEYLIYFKQEQYKVEKIVFVDNVYKKHSLAQLNEMFDKIESFNLDFKIKIDDIYYVSKTDYIQALTLIKNFAKQVNNLIYKNEQLSTFEKYILAFHFVANRVYHMDTFINNQMRNWVGVLTSKNVICSGYASLLTKICSEMFKKDELICFHQSSNVFDRNNTLLGGHANNLVFINDSKYDLCGVYHSDSCWCSPREKVLQQEDDQVKFNYCLIPLSELLVSTKYNFQFHSSNFIYEYLKANFQANNILLDHKKALIEQYLLEKYGFKSVNQLIKEISKSKFEVLKSQKKKDIEDNIINKFCNFATSLKYKPLEILEMKVPRILALEIFSEKDKNVEKFLNNLSSFVQGNDFDLEFIISMVKGDTLKDICKKVEEPEDLQMTCSFKELLLDVIYFTAKQSDLIKQGYEDYIKSLREKELQKFLKEHEKIINPDKINILKFKEPFEILAEHLNIKSSNIKSFVDRKLQETKELANKDFAGIFEPIEIAKEEDLF